MDKIIKLLNHHFGYSALRPGQAEAMRSVLEGRDTLLIMPTGGGKSLCFQLPALIKPGVALVVSPLIALMKDQVDGLVSRGIPAALINSSISPREAGESLAAAARGEIKLLYVAPERFSNAEFSANLKRLEISLFAVDEAHCISQWGHDFRPSYLRLSQAAEACGRPPIIALTATATPEVKEDIIAQLKMEECERIITGFARPNLHFGVNQSAESDKFDIIRSIARKFDFGSGLVYAGTRSKADEIVAGLLSEGLSAAAYHAGMDTEERKWVQDNFLSGKTKIVVATNAFGLGVDMPDIRFVVHNDFPGTLEAYYQEAGRAGRDGAPSFCLLLYNSRDRHLREFFIKGDNPPPETIREVYEFIASHEEDFILTTYDRIKQEIASDAPEMAIGTAVKILERYGYVGRSQEKVGNAYLKLLFDINAVLDGISSRARTQREAFERLFAYYGDKLYAGIDFSPDEFLQAMGGEREQVFRAIRKAEENGVIEYRPPFRGTEIRILKREPVGSLKIDYAELKEKLRRAYGKLDMMEGYVFTQGCRQRYILEYFGEKNPGRCGKCDVCIGGEQRKREKNKGREDKEHAGRSSAPAESKGVFGVDMVFADKAGFSTKLTQLETYELFKGGLSVAEIADKRGLTEGTIFSHLEYLIEKGEKVDIGRIMTKEQERAVLAAVRMTGLEKLKPIKELLGDAAGYDIIRLIVAREKKKAKRES